ncbi:hypothetical protein bering_62 [Salmonella phage bering]|uniref:Uncharacterized protein n=1 Tax=Salmonella phage bering TaxID=2713281 RepID=A0A6G9L8S9_9CAUD|nr:RNA polymerase ADP-ribosylase [Salmonella phage bering]QIQ61928.1 hypothetical protein bering_62 [Salmonella phage bering]
MTDQQIQNLFYLVHDKSHVMRPGTVSPTIRDLVKDLRVPQTTSLYRGLPREDVARLESMLERGDMFQTWDSCLSFSEFKHVAKKFARAYGTNAVLRVCFNHRKQLPEGLNVFGSLDKFVNKQDESEMDMLVLASIEKEWIFCQPRVMPVSRKIQVDGTTVFTVSLVTL